jgi:hypothetical protein
MLLEQHAVLRRDLEEARDQLRVLRVEELGARARDGLGVLSRDVGDTRAGCLNK